MESKNVSQLTFIHFRTQTKIKWCTFQTPQNSYSYMHLPTVTKSKTGNFHHKNQHLYPFKICKHVPPANTSINWSPLPLPPRKPSSIWTNTSINWSPPTLPPSGKPPSILTFEDWLVQITTPPFQTKIGCSNAPPKVGFDDQFLGRKAWSGIVFFLWTFSSEPSACESELSAFKHFHIKR